MLVLSRKVGQSVRIGDHVRLTVLDIGHGQVRLGIEAEGDIAVYREELFERIAAANREAAQQGPPKEEGGAPALVLEPTKPTNATEEPTPE